MAKAPPVPTAVGGATGEVSAMAVEKAGGGPVLQFAAALAGAVVGGAGATGLGRAATKAIAAAESAFLSGESAAAGRAAATAGAEAGAGVGAGAGSAGAGRAAASGELAAGETAAARAATSGGKPDAFALTPESTTQAVSRSPYAGRAGQVVEVEAQELGFSQTTVSFRKQRTLSDGRKVEYTYDDIKHDLYENGWPKNDSIDAVIMPPEGKLTSVDNTRLAAARELGTDKSGRPINPQVRVRRPDEKLTAEEQLRFERSSNDKLPETWGEAARERIRHQKRVPSGEEHGLTNVPKVTGRPK